MSQPDQHLQESERGVLKALYRAADIYQATVRPTLSSDTPDARRAFEEKKALQRRLLDALGAANEVLGPRWREEDR